MFAPATACWFTQHKGKAAARSHQPPVLTLSWKAQAWLISRPGLCSNACSLTTTLTKQAPNSFLTPASSGMEQLKPEQEAVPVRADLDVQHYEPSAAHAWPQGAGSHWPLHT